jgi:benzil reductase ((S)-benzoin forming)
MRLAVITGGSRGLGAALCDRYRGQGWDVLEFSRSAPHPFSVPLDLSDVRKASEVFCAEFERYADEELIEVVGVGNASLLGPVGPVEYAPLEGVVSHLHTNVISAVLFARAFVSAFQEHACPKTFVNISSGAAGRGVAGWSLYCASKAALENYVRSVAEEQSAQTHPYHRDQCQPGRDGHRHAGGGPGIAAGRLPGC